MRPRDCGGMTEDLECLGCGEKLWRLRDGRCGYEEWEKQEAVRKEAAERAELARLTAKYEVPRIG